MCSLLLQCSTGYYQYNIDQNFKGSVKIFEKMGYVVEKQIGKPRYQVLEMKLGQINREVLASVLIELVFFGLELDVLIECVEFLQNPNIILEALEARKNAGGGVDVLIGYLMSKKRDKPMVPPYSPAQRKVNNQHQASSRGSGNSSVTSESYHTPQGSYRAPVASSDKSRNDSQGSNSPIPYVDPSNLNLPPPQPEPEPDPSSGNLDSMRHIDASSERDDGDTLIPDSTQLGYRNPPPTKTSSTYYGSNAQDYAPQATSTTSEDSTRPKDFYSGGRLPHNHPSAFNQPTDTGASRGRKSQFSSLGSNQNSEMKHLRVNTQSAGSNAPGSFARQNSMSADNSSVHPSGGSIVPVTTGTVTLSPVITGSGNRSAVAGVPTSSSTPLNYATGTTNTSGSSSTTSSTTVYANLPINVEDTSASTSAFIPTCGGEKLTSSTPTSAATPDYVNVPIDDQSSLTAPRHGKLDIQNLRKGLAKKKELTKNFEVQSSSETFTQGENRDLDTLKDDLRRKKETRVKVEGMNDDNMSGERRRKEDSKADYDNIEMYWSQPGGVKSDIKYPLNKPPISTPRSKVYKPSVETFALWQCANCKQENQAFCKECRGCHKMLGDLAVTDAFCDFCNMIIFYRHGSNLDNITCRRCKGKLSVSSIV